MTAWRSLFELPWAQTLAGTLLLIGAAWLSAVLARLLLARAVHVFSRRTDWHWDDAFVKRGVFRKLARVLPMVVIGSGIAGVPGVAPSVEALVARVATALAALFVLLAIGAALSAAGDLYESDPARRKRSIKGYLQLSKIIVFVLGGIVIVAVAVDRNAISLIAGLGAVSAVLLLIFKDTILSVVASVQLGSDEMLRVGDWIVMPDDNVDGDVIEIALHTVKVVNWDKTISTVPTWHLISKSFRNYRNMYATGRRIRRALHIDVTSVRFLEPGEVDRLRRFKLLAGYFERKRQEIDQADASLGSDGEAAVNRRRLSNLGTFRAYVQAYVTADPKVNTQLFWAVRQLDPGPTGVPLQIYGYTVDTGFVAHHGAQDDIFEHLIAILPEFGLRLFQQPTGADLHAGLARIDRDQDPATIDHAGAPLGSAGSGG